MLKAYKEGARRQEIYDAFREALLCQQDWDDLNICDLGVAPEVATPKVVAQAAAPVAVAPIVAVQAVAPGAVAPIVAAQKAAKPGAQIAATPEAANVSVATRKHTCLKKTAKLG